MNKNSQEEGTLKEKIAESEHIINLRSTELKEKQTQREELLGKLNIIRCKSILRDIDKIVGDFLKLKQPLEILKTKVIEIQTSDSAWWKLPQQLGEDGIYTQLADSEFRPDRIKSLDLLTFLQRIKAFSGSKDKTKFKF